MTNSRTTLLSEAGVSIWLDDLSRDMIRSGRLRECIAERNVVGVTTNPTIFAAAIGRMSRGTDSTDTESPDADSAYAIALADCAQRGLTPLEAVIELTCADVAAACDELAATFTRSSGRDGWVSIEVSPAFAHDTAATVAHARELWEQIDRPNVMIKIPATEAGLVAIAEVIGLGISVNATLVFGLTRYRQVLNAYFSGLERARSAGISLAQIHSVASVFVSRFDVLIDPQLDALGSSEATALRGHAGIANARLIAEASNEGHSSGRAFMLLAAGANPQRTLWASTGVKDPLLPDTLYVSELAIPGTVNTMPTKTLEAFADHGEISDRDLAAEFREADYTLNALDALGIDYATAAAQLEVDGLTKFEASWAELLALVETGMGATTR